MSCCRLCCSQVPVSALALRMSNSVLSTSVLDTASVCSTPLNLLILSSACCPSLQETCNTSLPAAGYQVHPCCKLHLPSTVCSLHHGLQTDACLLKTAVQAARSSSNITHLLQASRDS